MKRLIAVLAIGVVVTSLPGCSATGGGDRTGRATALTSATADHLVVMETPSWAKDTIRNPATIITSTKNTSMPWLFVSRSTDDRSIQLVWVAGGGCTTFDGVRVDETAAKVTVTVSGTTDWRAEICSADLRTGAGTVSLAAPLGNRTLWHAPVHEQWVVPGGILGSG